MDESRKKPGRVFWASVASIVVLIGFPSSLMPIHFASLGPFTGLYIRGLLPKWSWQFANSYFAPRDLALRGSQTFGDVYFWYVGFWIPDPSPGIR